MVDRVKAPHVRLNEQLAGAKKRLDDAENEIRGVSERRLAELMKRSDRERFDELDSPDLTNSDRAKLRRAIAARLCLGKMELFVSRGGFWWPRLTSWLRYRGATAVAVTAIAAPACFLTALAWRNTGEIFAVPNAVTMDWTLPSGGVEQTTLKIGDRLVVIPRSGKSHVVRRWIPKQGYATSQFDSD
jgi:hypothetical protein